MGWRRRRKCFHTNFWFASNHFYYLNTLFTAILYYIYHMNIYPCSIAMNTVDSVVRYMPLMPQHTWVWDNWGGAMLIARSSLGKTQGRQQWKDASLHQCILPRIAMRPYRLSSWVVRSGVLRRTSRYRRERTCWGENAMIAILSLFALRMKAEGTCIHWYATMADFKISYNQIPSLSGLSPDTMSLS